MIAFKRISFQEQWNIVGKWFSKTCFFLFHSSNWKWQTYQREMLQRERKFLSRDAHNVIRWKREESTRLDQTLMVWLVARLDRQRVSLIPMPIRTRVSWEKYYEKHFSSVQCTWSQSYQNLKCAECFYLLCMR